MSNKIKRFYLYAFSHKKFSGLILIFVCLTIYGLFFRSSSSTAATQYIFAKAEKQNVTATVSGSGQVSALDQVDLTADVSGTVDYVSVKIGDNVVKGQSIAHFESTDAKRAVQNAELNLTNAKIAYEKAKKIYGNQIGQSTTTVSDLEQSLNDGYNAVANAFIDLPKIFMDVSEIYYNPTNSPYFSDTNISQIGGDTGLKYKYDAGITFDAAKKDYENIFKKYKNSSINSSQSEIVELISETNAMIKKLSAALTGTHNTIDYLSDRMTSNIPPEVSTDKALLSSYITKTLNHSTKLSSALTTIEEAENSATTAEINLKSAELSLNQAQDSLKTAEENLANHTIVSPFDGVIAKVPVEVGDKVNNNGSVASVITKSKKVTISLNEVDAAKIKIGDKAVLNFDAIDGLTIEGTVYEIDVVGTVSNGVVSYGVSISFDSNDDRIKAGMTTSISIAVGSAQNVLAVPSSAISTKDGKSFVLVPVNQTGAKSTTDKTSLKELGISTGLSGDELTEVTTGLNEGETYVSSTKTASSAKSSSGSLFSMFGNNRNRTSSSSSGNSNTTKSSTSSAKTGSGQGENMPTPPQ